MVKIAPPSLLLASQSPRRQALLKGLGLCFSIVKPDFDELSVAWQGFAGDYVELIAKGKAMSIKQSSKEALVLSADTLVICHNRPYGKPGSWQEAFAMLSALQGGWHSVYTGLCLRRGEECQTLHCKTDVFFNPLSPEQVRGYLEAIDWQDRAGSYIMGHHCTSLLVSQIRGCYYNIIGLPVSTLEQLLNRFGYTLWNDLPGKALPEVFF